jgi:two-component system alkaline phosphatase synthesis response regulator PhoP
MSYKVLLTDDDEMVLISLEELLLAENIFDVTTASNGKDAIAKAQAETFDLIVLDIVMPGMSGIEVCKTLRGMEDTKETPIIMLTAKSAEADKKTGLEAGANIFLPKPTDPVKFVEIVKETLGA